MNSYAKGIMSILTISMLLAASVPLMTSAIGIPPGADSADWYKTVEGVIDTDTYTLYPYQAKPLTIGFSKFGEMINLIDKVGLQYGITDGRDPFAPLFGSTIPDLIPEHKWLEGWLINITYFDSFERMRNVWATALHADTRTAGIGNGWVRVDDDYVVPGGATSESDEKPTKAGYYIGSSPAQYGYGGRITNGSVVTEPLEVLYDGPRRFVARCVNHIYDWWEDGGTEHLVDVIITIDFNKVKKEVVVMKDVKLIPVKALYTPIPPEFWGEVHDYTDQSGLVIANKTITDPILGIFVQFSNRGEWDLGKPGTLQSYAHFYTEGNNGTYADGDYREAGYWGYDVYNGAAVNDDPVMYEGLSTVYGYEYELTTTAPPTTWSRHGMEPWPDHPFMDSTFDLAQIISDDKKYVGWAAYWPSCSDWSVDGLDLGQWWKSLASYDKHPIDGTTKEPWLSPYVIGEWDFVLDKTSSIITITDPDNNFSYDWKIDKQFRGVTVYGVTDLHTDNEGCEADTSEGSLHAYTS